MTHPVLFDGSAELLRRIVAKGGRNFWSPIGQSSAGNLGENCHFISFYRSGDSCKWFSKETLSRLHALSKDKYQIASGLVIGDRPLDIEAGRQLALTPISLIICSILKNL